MRRPALSVLSWLLAAVLIGWPQPASAAGPRVDLRVLVVTDGGYSVSAIVDRLRSEGVPYRAVDLRDPGRPVIDEAFLSDTAGGAPRAKYQAVVLPNASPFEDEAELAALADYEARFGIRQLDADVYPSADVGMRTPGYSGSLDGVTAGVTAEGRAGAFRYLRGPVPFDDDADDVGESYGHLAAPLPDNPTTGTSFQPFITATVEETTGTLAGVYHHDGRSEMVLTFSYSGEQRHFQTIGHGLITWLTKGVHLGYNRNYLGVHVDDVLMPDARWSIEHNCTLGADCPDGLPADDIRMAPADVAYAADWQARRGLTLDLAFNGTGSDEAIEEHGSDPLTDAFVRAPDRFRWLNHTYGHFFLGCVQDFTVTPWRCLRMPGTGDIVYVGERKIKREVGRNVGWAARHGITINASELVTGEHSGLRKPPQQPDDNPNLAPALSDARVTWLASDASQDGRQRRVGSLWTVPRHPVNVYYNAATRAEEVDEYNWIYTRRSDGGSGLCEDHPDTMTCIEPLDPGTGYTSYIVPAETRIMLSHVLGNDPRPHYAHQSNLAEDRILYPLLDRVLGAYRSAFAGNTPLVNDSMSALGAELRRQDAWRAALRDGAMADGDVTAYIQDGTVRIRTPSGLEVPVTAPEGTREGPAGEPFGRAYAGERSAYRSGDVTLTPPGA